MQINELLKTNANVTLSVNILDLKEWAIDLIENAMFIDGLARDLSTEINIVDKFSRQRTLKIITQ